MDIRDIEKAPIFPHMSREIKRLRTNAPKMIKHIIERSYVLDGVKSLGDLGKGSINVLTGGMLSTTYLLKQADDAKVIKFRYKGVAAEAEALRAWRETGANVTEVQKVGVIQIAKKTGGRIKYLVQRAILGKGKNIAPVSQDFVMANPKKARKVGIVLGQELAKMHKARANRTFGEFADMWGNTAPIKTWNNYLIGYVKAHFANLLEIGVNEQQLKNLIEKIKSMKFTNKGRYIHGDFSMRNAIVESKRPIKLKIFDPNPLVGDPSWDIAILFNNHEFAKRKYELRPKDKALENEYFIHRDVLSGFVQGYEDQTGKRINRQNVIVAQVIQSLFLLDIERNKLKKGTTKDDIEVKIRTDAVLDGIEFLVPNFKKLNYQI